MYGNYISKIIEYEINNLSPVVLEWISKIEAEENISGVLETFFKNNFTEKNDKVFLQNKNSADSEKEDFKTHIIDLGNNKFAITAIEIGKENQTDFPAIELIFKNFNMSDLKREEFDKIIQRYKLLSPECLRYYEFNKNKGSQNYFGAAVENITMAGSINTVRNLPKNGNYEKVKIEPLDSMDFYPVYSDEYDLFFESNKTMINKVEKETFDTLENILKSGKLYKAVIDDEFAGVFEIVKNKQLYFKSYFVREEILFKQFRGKGYGPVFQRKVIESLPDEEFKIICGMIHSQNNSSLRTAMSCGRTAMETSFLIKLKH